MRGGGFRLDDGGLSRHGLGGGPLLSGRQADHQDRLIPLINIVFLLLCFFMIAGTIRAVDVLDVELPEAESRGGITEPMPALLVDRAGGLAFAGERGGVEAIGARIGAWHARHPAAVLQIKADRKARAGIVLPLLAKLSQAGIERIELIVIRRERAR